MTTTVNKTLAGIIDNASPDNLPDALQQVKLGTLLTPQRRTITIASATTMAISPAALGPGTMSVRVVTGTATGARDVQDSGGTPTTTVATLSDDGATLTFEAAITVAVVDYLPRSASDITADFPQTGLG